MMPKELSQMLLAIHGLHKAFTLPNGEHLTVLRHVDVVLQAGQSCVITGPSGVGKSTLLHCVMGYEDAQATTWQYQHHAMASLPLAQRQHLMASSAQMVLQKTRLIPELNVLENIMLPLQLHRRGSYASCREKALHVLESVQLTSWQDHKVQTLSGGQASRVALARALVMEPALLCADEPTGNLDQATAHEIFHLMMTQVRTAGMGFLFVTHDPQWIPYFDIHLCLE